MRLRPATRIRAPANGFKFHDNSGRVRPVRDGAADKARQGAGHWAQLCAEAEIAGAGRADGARLADRKSVV